MNRSRALFAVTAVAVVAGAIVALAGTQVAWVRAVTPGRMVSEEGASFRFPDTIETYDADDLGSGSTPLAGALLAVSLLPLLTGPRARPFLYAGCVVLAGFVVVSSQAGTDVDFAGTVTEGSGRIVVSVGGALAFAAALVAIGPSSAVPRLRLPERAPDEEASAVPRNRS